MPWRNGPKESKTPAFFTLLVVKHSDQMPIYMFWQVWDFELLGIHAVAHCSKMTEDSKRGL